MTAFLKKVAVLVEPAKSLKSIKIFSRILNVDYFEGKAQDTFIKAYTHLDLYFDRGKPLGWLYTIAGNTAKNALKRLNLILKKLFPLKFMLLSFMTKTRLKEAKIIFVKIYAVIFTSKNHVKMEKTIFVKIHATIFYLQKLCKKR